MMLMAKEIIPGGQQKAREIFARRKSPLKLCNWLGWGFLIKLLCHRLTVADAETRTSALLEMRCKAIITRHACIGMDIDKPSDLDLQGGRLHMVKAKRIERVAALSKLLADHPYRLFSFSYFCKKFAIAKSTLSEDVLAVKSGLELYGLGKVETVSGAAGGVRFIPGHLPEDDAAFLEELAARLTSPDRILPGGMLYTTDILCHPETVVRLGEIFSSACRSWHRTAS